jgi:hypothetical protein
MTVIKRLFLAFFALNLAATAVNAMGICFGGYPGGEFVHYFSSKYSQIYLSPEKLNSQKMCNFVKTSVLE